MWSAVLVEAGALAWPWDKAPSQAHPPPPPPSPAMDEMLIAWLEEFVAAHPYLLAALALFVVVKLWATFGGKKPGKWVPKTSDEYAPATPRCTDPKGEVEIGIAKSGLAAAKPLTLPALFKAAAKGHGSKRALKVERGGAWKTWTWQEYYDESKQAARAFISLGLEQHDCINVIGFNSPEWIIAQMGAILAGGKAAGVYTTNEASACKYIAEHSEAKVVVLEDEAQLKKYLSIKDELPALKAIVQWMGAVPEEKDPKLPVYSWAEFLKLGAEGAADEARSAGVRPGHCATLIYTSGTTGNPKAVMVSHDNLIYCCVTALGSSVEGLELPDEARMVSYLPLSHVAAQALDIINPIVVTSMGHVEGHGDADAARLNASVWFARPDALKGTLKHTLVAARPTIFFGVPRVWEKIRESMLEIGRKNSPTKQKVAAWAKKHALAAAKERQVGGSGARTVSYLIARKVILSKVKAALGLDKCLACVTGAAPMSREVMEYFASLDLDILDVYGMSESSGATTINTPGVHQFGTVGPAISANELKVDHVPGRDKPGEGEVCYRGRHIMMGYMKDPAKTAEAIDPEGWLHSGDVGLIDGDGLLHITGRIKELIITAGGENIAPVPIEDKIKELCPALSNVMLVGDKRKYNVALVTLKTILDPDTGLSTDKLAPDAARVDPKVTTATEAKAQYAVKGSPWETYLTAGLKEYNSKWTVSNAQKVQKLAILPGDFSEKGGELTATLKLKRGPASEKHAAEIEALYAE